MNTLIPLEVIYYPLHSQKLYSQIGFPENAPFYGNVLFYQLNLQIANNEIWISSLGAQIQQPQQLLTPVIILAPPYIHLPSHGLGSGA